MRERLPKPGDPGVFAQCALQDAERDADSPLVLLHRDLMRLRRNDAVLQHVGSSSVRDRELCSDALGAADPLHRRRRSDRLLVVNLADDHLSPMNEPLMAPPRGGQWTLLWSSEHPQYGGGGTVPFVEAGRWLDPRSGRDCCSVRKG